MLTLGKRVLFALVATAIASQSASAQSEGVPWRTDYQSACAEAQQSGKLVLAHFWTNSCGPCKQLDQRVFSQPQVAMGVASQYVPVKINATEHPELAQAMGVTRVPTDAVVTPDGKLVKSFISPATPMEYVGYVNRLAAAYRSQAGAAYASAAKSAPIPAAQPTSSPAPNFNEAYAQLMASGQPAPSQNATPQAANVAQTNPYAAPHAQQPATTPAPPITPIEPATTVAQNAVPSPVTPAQPAAQQPSPQTVAQAGPQLPPGSPPLGFEGFCPVTMKNNWRWAKGDVRFGAIHRGRTYLFASAEAQKTFLASPDAYSPVLAGSDPVVAVDERRSVAGTRNFAVQYPTDSGRFYMFSSQETLEKFWSSPESYATGAERVAALPASDSFIR